MSRHSTQALLALPLLTLTAACGVPELEDTTATCGGPGEPRCAQPSITEIAFPHQDGEVRSTLLIQEDGSEEEIQYEVIDGFAVYQGDIILGRVDKLDAQLDGAGIENHGLHWPNRTIYYAVDPGLPQKNRVYDAIDHWELNTDLNFVPRTSESSYIYFTNGNGCASPVGKQGGRQDIVLTTGKSASQIVGMAIAKTNDRVYAWYDDGMVSAGTSDELDSALAQYPFTLPAGYTQADVIDMAIATNDRVYTFFKNGKYSSGSSADLDSVTTPQNFSLPPGYALSQVAGMDFASTGKLYVYYTNNKVSVGTASDFDAYEAPYNVATDFSISSAVGFGIAGTTDYVYSWYTNGKVATGWSGDLNAYASSYDYSPPGHCSTGSTIHEIGHSAGLWHEQSRCDRNSYVTINWGNVIDGKEHNFDNYCGGDGRDLAAYDFGSIMHYDSFAFSANGMPTIVKKDGTTFTTQRNGLSSNDIRAVAELYGYSPAQGSSASDIVGVAIAPNDYVYAWYDDGKVSYGKSFDLDEYQSKYNYSLPSGRTAADIVAMAIAKGTSKVYTWYDDGKLSIGTSNDLDYYQGPTSVSMPSGYSVSQIRGIGIAPDGDKVYTWWSNGKVTIGTSTDLDAHQGPTTVSLPAGKTMSDVVEIDIADSTSHVYVWFDDYSLTIGTSTDLDYYQGAW